MTPCATSQTREHSRTQVSSPILGPEKGKERLFIKTFFTGFFKLQNPINVNVSFTYSPVGIA